MLRGFLLFIAILISLSAVTAAGLVVVQSQYPVTVAKSYVRNSRNLSNKNISPKQCIEQCAIECGASPQPVVSLTNLKTLLDSGLPELLTALATFLYGLLTWVTGRGSDLQNVTLRITQLERELAQAKLARYESQA